MTAQTRERPAPAGRPFAERTLKAAPDAPQGTSRLGWSTDPEEVSYLSERYGNRGFQGYDLASNTVFVSTIEVDRTRCTCGAKPVVACALAAHG